MTIINKEQFIEALEEAGLACVTTDSVVETAETIDNFTAQWGETNDEYNEGGLTIHEWTNKQRFKGDVRRNIYVVDFGDKRAVAVI